MPSWANGYVAHSQNAATLRALTHIGAALPNETRWADKHEMVKRYFRIEQCVTEMKELDS